MCEGPDVVAISVDCDAVSAIMGESLAVPTLAWVLRHRRVQ